MKDSELKKDRIYWAEIIDPELKAILGKEIRVRFSGILFHNFDSPTEIFFLSQIKIFREVSAKENPSCNSNQI